MHAIRYALCHSVSFLDKEDESRLTHDDLDSLSLSFPLDHSVKKNFVPALFHSYSMLEFVT